MCYSWDFSSWQAELSISFSEMYLGNEHPNTTTSHSNLFLITTAIPECSLCSNLCSLKAERKITDNHLPDWVYEHVIFKDNWWQNRRLHRAADDSAFQTPEAWVSWSRFPVLGENYAMLWTHPIKRCSFLILLRSDFLLPPPYQFWNLLLCPFIGSIVFSPPQISLLALQPETP